MTIRGKIKNGKAILNDPNAIPDGTEVEIRPAKKLKAPRKKRQPKVPPRSVTERLASIIGKAKNLPPDASVNVDYYLYGAPKQQ